MDAVEAAVAEDDDHVAAAGFCFEALDDGVRVRFEPAGLATRGDGGGDLGGVETLIGGDLLRVRHGGDDAGIGLGEGFDELVLQHVAAAGVRAGLKQGPQAAAGVALAQAAQRLANRGGVMTEVVNDRHAILFTALLLAAADATEALQAVANLRVAQSAEAAGADAHGGVAGVEFTDHRHLKGVAIQREGRALRRGASDDDAEVAGGAQTDRFERSGAFCTQREAVRVVAIDEHQAVARHGVEEALKAQQDGIEIVKNVRVIELDVVHDGALRQVVEEFAALVEVGGVVFVALDDEDVGMREACTRFEILRHAANHEAGVLARVLEKPRQHGGGGRFAMRAADDKAAFALNDLLLEHFGHRDVGQLLFEQRFEFRIAAGDGIAHDIHIGIERQIFRFEAGEHRNAGIGQHIAHRGIDLVIAAADVVAERFQSDRGGPHRGAADADEVNVLGRLGHESGRGRG